ncbi:hypothetical protein ACJRO7_024702 [Eucalyptus globulus]|uniref:Uncharacterized protein n=1 Tax=Eucalyptus globulus TaxID=34317 RepID=A0ABD3K8J8_EUCGL
MTSVESFPMNDGNGVYSYLHNSCMQRRGIDVAVKMIVEAITEKLDVELLLSSSSIFRIVDSGCSVGPNTCFVVERVTESIKLKYQCQGLDLKNLEFQAFLNDQASLQFIHSSYALQWLLRVPPQVTERKIFHLEQGEDSHSRHATRHRGGLPRAISAELGAGGLMAILIPSTPPCSKSIVDLLVQLLESALMELVSLEASEVMANATVMHIRAGWEGLIKAHFGSEIVHPVFEHFRKKVMESSIFAKPCYSRKAETFIFLKRL